MHRDRAREMRKVPTEAESFVWMKLRDRRFVGFKFRRQVPLGNYIVDFCCFDRRLIVELDGGQHNDAKHRAYDERRDAWLKSQGFKVVRYWNYDVLQDWQLVEDAIWNALHEGETKK